MSNQRGDGMNYKVGVALLADTLDSTLDIGNITNELRHCEVGEHQDILKRFKKSWSLVTAEMTRNLEYIDNLENS